ncbi:autotransporter domain-containing protein [Polynucleobacter necessarius]|uniref:autotransporter domain-containing protein n=1 Tax=Polynucleobacter necessarius TaxID=576610 RepID=UPI000E097808|nr:autotransporter domain-containing protein [Polynucleobacter necessarius]
MQFIGFFRHYLILTTATVALSTMPNSVIAQSTGGCDSYTPNTVSGSSQTVACTSSVTPAATTGVISTQNSTTVGNNVTIDVANGTSLVINGSTIGLGGNASVSNHGNLNTSSFYYGYGMSSGANGRSQAGGTSFTNESDGTIFTGGTYAAGMYISATNASSAANALTNAGRIQTDGVGAAGMRLVSGATSGSVLNSIVNTGLITTNGSAAHGIQVSGVGTVAIENTGTITANGVNSFGIYSAGNITTLTNSQGGSNPLTYSGVLPSNYNTKISSATNYGKLDASNGVVTGAMNFGITINSTVSPATYSTALSGIKINNLANSYGTVTIGGTEYQWALVHRINGSADQADLVLSAVVQPTLVALEETLAAQSLLIVPIGPDTEIALNSMANTLQGLFAMQSAGVINGMSYDCSLFGANNVCISAGGRFTNVSSYPYNNSSALIIGAYRFSNNLRFGGYLDQNLSQSTPGEIAQLNNGSPMVGVFGVWLQNPDGTGVEAKLSAGYANKGASLTRPVVGVSEAGTGSTSLTSQGVLGLLKYGFGMGNKTILSPYASMRYMVGGMGGYGESQSNTVSSPLTYDAINNYTTTVLAGVSEVHRLSEKTSLLASAGVEKDTNSNVGNLVTTGNGYFNIAMNNNYRSTRPTASLGAFHDLSVNERIGLSAIYRQEAYQAITSTTVMATYTIGL